jgi:RNA polymerase sigma-70 factor (ECF subfamily)
LDGGAGASYNQGLERVLKGKGAPVPHDDFADFIRRIRAGDAEAAAELLRRHKNEVRLEVRLKLRNPRLRRLFDSMDICQEAFLSFVVRAMAGQYDLDRPENLIALLVVIARRKVDYHARRQLTQRRGRGRVVSPPPGYEPAVAAPGPSDTVEISDWLEQFRRRLTAEERQLAELREQGCSWEEIAAAVGGTAQARRVQLARARERVARELKLDEAGVR